MQTLWRCKTSRKCRARAGSPGLTRSPVSDFCKNRALRAILPQTPLVCVAGEGHILWEAGQARPARALMVARDMGDTTVAKLLAREFSQKHPALLGRGIRILRYWMDESPRCAGTGFRDPASGNFALASIVAEGAGCLVDEHLQLFRTGSEARRRFLSTLQLSNLGGNARRRSLRGRRDQGRWQGENADKDF